ncbi:MAG: hypothetical protein JWM76_198 [Pseudonocardiales bacterium]|nr:hypothetical protein [Pseudonocardiales bacterium]
MSESTVLFRLANQIDEQAASARDGSRRLGVSTAQLLWHSPAADLFRARARPSVMSLNRSAVDLEHAAAALRRHARSVHRVEEIAAAVEQAGERVVSGVAHAGQVVARWLT